MAGEYSNPIAQVLYDTLGSAKTGDALDGIASFCNESAGLSDSAADIAGALTLSRNGNYNIADAIWKLAESVESVADAIQQLGDR